MNSLQEKDRTNHQNRIIWKFQVEHFIKIEIEINDIITNHDNEMQ